MPTLLYFDVPARGEVARLINVIGKLGYEDKRVEHADWMAGHCSELKAKCPFGQVPVLFMEDGKCLAQSAAIDRYLAKLAGLMPEDPLTAAQADEAYFFCEDVFQTIYPTFRLQDEEEKLRARQELVKGKLGDMLTMLSKLLESRPGKFLTGDCLTHGDLAVFCQVSFLSCGWELMAGFPADLLDPYPVLKDYRNSVAAVPEIAAFYSNETHVARVQGFRVRP